MNEALPRPVRPATQGKAAGHPMTVLFWMPLITVP
jgi:hypothetical protein